MENSFTKFSHTPEQTLMVKSKSKIVDEDTDTDSE